MIHSESLETRTALVTGGSGDIGGACARALAHRGADIVIHYHRDEEGAQRRRREIEALGSRSIIAQGDLTSRQDAIRVADEATAFGSVDVLVNAAGDPLCRVPWLELSDEFLDRVFALNFKAPLFVTQAIVPHMIGRRRGVVINILSVAAHTAGTDTVFHYGAAKGALLSLTRGLARVLAPQGVRVVGVAPGTIAGDMQRRLTGPELAEKLLSDVPIGRIGTPEDVGELVGFLATDAAGFIVGETIEVNGGIFMY